jgi:hypothetical protein
MMRRNLGKDKGVMLEGRAMSWTVPLRGREGFTSVLDVAGEEGFIFVLYVTTHTLEEHVWPTRPGQRVRADDVVFDSPREGRTRSCWLVEKEMEEGKKCVSFVDLPLDKIIGLRRGETGLDVFLETKAEVLCVDAEHSKQLLDIGVGGLVQLFNVKVSTQGDMFVTSRSGVRRVEREPPPVIPLSPPLPLGPPQKPTKWICITCNYVNYPGVSVCRGCSLQRKQGPLKGSAWNFRVDSIPKRQFKRFPQWQCLQCDFRDNFYFAQNDCCARCGAMRNVELKSMNQKRKRLKTCF